MTTMVTASSMMHKQQNTSQEIKYYGGLNYAQKTQEKSGGKLDFDKIYNIMYVY